MLALDGAVPDVAQVTRMTDAIRHRGPDDSGILVEGPVALGFRRLSILDLSPAGHQPMQAADGQVSIVFNGEIYNYLELREQLVTLGHSFRSSGDSEVLLHAYLQWGRDCVTRFNGMWAFVINDSRTGTMFGSRDRFGVKPLFRCATTTAVAFASEIKAILAGGLVRAQPQATVVANYLADNRLDDSADTFFEGIVHVPAAHCFELDRAGRYRQWRYWSVDAAPQSPADPAAAFADIFEDAVRLHMRSDVPVAVHLSGGLDSTAIACASVRVRREAGATGALAAFCYMDSRFDEQVYINATLQQTGAAMSPLQCTPQELWDTLPLALRAHDEPMHSMTALVGFQLMRLTAQHGIKVVLNGQGADETLAGYGSYFHNYWQSLLERRAFGDLISELKVWSGAHEATLMPTLVGVLRRHLQAGLRRFGPYRRASESRWHGRMGQQDWLAPAVRDAATPPQFSEQNLDAALSWSVQRDPLPIYLRVEDRNSSAHSIEGRVPFLDHRLVALAFSLAPEWHMRGTLNKFVLREAMRGRIPEVVRARGDKMGFPTAAAEWLRAELYEPAREIVTDPQFRQSGAVDATRVATMLDAHRAGQGDYASEVFRAVQWFLWQRHCVAQSAQPTGVFS